MTALVSAHSLWTPYSVFVGCNFVGIHLAAYIAGFQCLVRTLQTVAYICVGYFVNCTCSQVHILVCAHICTYVGKYTHACTALSSHYCTNIHVLCMHKHTLLHCLNMHLHVHACCSLSNMSFNTRVCIFTWPTCIFSVQTCSSACIRAFECAFMIFTSLI
jgi:hypothetical protein